MPDERLARTLLRLYPRTWRARYGDEFLALVAESGLSWRAVLDVVAAASVERVRAAIALSRSEDDPATGLLPVESRPVREIVAVSAAFMLFVGLTVAVRVLD